MKKTSDFNIRLETPKAEDIRTDEQKEKFLSFEEARDIVTNTIVELSSYTQDSQMIKYLSDHRVRLANTLALIPKSKKNMGTLLDVGCYGYLGFWAKKFLGYSLVEGIQYDESETKSLLEVSGIIEQDTIRQTNYNFDLNNKIWPINKQYETIVMLETLEHIAHDPMNVMVHINDLLEPEGQLVISVPNTISYNTVRNMMAGLPPQNYWFYHTDVKHEPRHQFEYTPLFLHSLVSNSGFKFQVFRTDYYTSSKEANKDMHAVAELLSLPTDLMGDTIITLASKNDNTPHERYPDFLYSYSEFYKTKYQSLIKEANHAIENISTNMTLNKQIDELLYLCNCYHQECVKKNNTISYLQEKLNTDTSTFIKALKISGKAIKNPNMAYKRLRQQRGIFLNNLKRLIVVNMQSESAIRYPSKLVYHTYKKTQFVMQRIGF